MRLVLAYCCILTAGHAEAARSTTLNVTHADIVLQTTAERS